MQNIQRIDDPIFVPWIDNPQILRRFSRKFQLVVSTNCFLSLSFSVASLERNELTKLTRVRTSLKLVRGMEKKRRKGKKKERKEKKITISAFFRFHAAPSHDLPFGACGQSSG